MKIALLLCDDVRDEMRHCDGTYTEMFGRLLKLADAAVEMSVFDVRVGEYPAVPEDFDGYVSTGSRYSVYDDEPWIRQFETFIRKLDAAAIPFFGVCFGHQMLARALGGATRKSDKGWGVGVHQVEVVEAQEWMQPPAASFKVIVSHQDQVEELPEDSLLLGSNSHCAVSMFRVGNSVGMQGHPEYRAAFARPLMQLRQNSIQPHHFDEAEQRWQLEPDQSLLAQWIISFIRTCK